MCHSDLLGQCQRTVLRFYNSLELYWRNEQQLSESCSLSCCFNDERVETWRSKIFHRCYFGVFEDPVLGSS